MVGSSGPANDGTTLAALAALRAHVCMLLELQVGEPVDHAPHLDHLCTGHSKHAVGAGSKRFWLLTEPCPQPPKSKAHGLRRIVTLTSLTSKREVQELWSRARCLTAILTTRVDAAQQALAARRTDARIVFSADRYPDIFQQTVDTTPAGMKVTTSRW